MDEWMDEWMDQVGDSIIITSLFPLHIFLLYLVYLGIEEDLIGLEADGLDDLPDVGFILDDDLILQVLKQVVESCDLRTVGDPGTKYDLLTTQLNYWCFSYDSAL